jgi:prepilin peptidase CpaA
MGVDLLSPQLGWPAAGVLFTVMLAMGLDFTTRRIPNTLTAPAAVAGILFHATATSGQGSGFALSGLLVGGALMLVFFLMGGMGGGDVKLMACLGAWLGPVAVVNLFVLTALGGALLALTLIACRRRLAPIGYLGRDVQAALRGERRPADFCSAQMPYAIAFGLGAVAHFIGLQLIG